MVLALILFLRWLFRNVRKEVSSATGGGFVPATQAEVELVASRLYPRLLQYRERIAAHQAFLIRREMEELHGLAVYVPDPPEYRYEAVVKMVSYAAGFSPKLVHYEPGDVDEGVDDSEDYNVTDIPSSVEAFEDRLCEGFVRHASMVANDMVMDTADANVVVSVDEVPDGWDSGYFDGFDDQFPGEEQYWENELERHRRERERRGGDSVVKLPAMPDLDVSRPMGVVLGWARVLTGAENCGFCAMLAARGPVYDSAETASMAGMSRRGVRNRNPTARQIGQSYHTNCDCRTVLVVKGQPWEGQRQFEALKDLWDEASIDPTGGDREYFDDYERWQMERGNLHSPFARFRNRVNRLQAGNEFEFVADSLQVSQPADVLKSG